MVLVTTTDLAAREVAGPRIARLVASVAPPVKTISSAAAPISCATSARARSTASCARRPSAYAEDGLPNSPRRNGSIASSTWASTGVVALWSR